MADENTTNTTSQTVPTRQLRVKRKTAVVAGVFALVACLVIGTVLYGARKKQNDAAKQSALKASPPPKLLTRDKIPEPSTDYDKTIISVDKLIASGDYEAAIKELQQYEPKATDPVQRFAITNRLGSVYSTIGESKAALGWFEKAQQTNQPGSDSLSLNIAITAEQIGDKPKAIAAYNKVIELIKAHPNPTSDATIAGYQKKIKALGG